MTVTTPVTRIIPLPITALRGDVGTVWEECRGRDVQRLPHPELRGVQAEVRGTVHRQVLDHGRAEDASVTLTSYFIP